MKEVFAVIGVLFVALGLIFGLGFVFAYPTMWLVNYLFTPTFLTFVFGTATLNVWHAWALNILAGLLFKSTSTSTSK